MLRLCVHTMSFPQLTKIKISHPKKGSFVPSSSSANGATTLAKFSTSRIDPVQWKKKKLSTLASVAENQKSPNPKLD